MKTLTDIAKERNVARHKLEYIVRTRGVEPKQVIGRTRLFDPQDILVHLHMTPANLPS